MASSCHWVRIEQFRGQLAVVLSSERLEATFLPSFGMLGASLTLDGDEYLSLQGGTRAFAAGHTTGMPLLHPWANRLAGSTYRSCGVDVSLTGVRAVHRDGNRLPIHGTMVGAREWELLELSATAKRARVVSSFDYGADDGLLAAFPFPHVVEVTATVRGQELTVQTVVRPTTAQKVPVSFGWHPYFRLPGARRSTWQLHLPKRRHLALDRRGLPTGESSPEPAENDPIGSRRFDDLYELGGKAPRTLGLAGGGRKLTVELDEGYPFAQVYVPPRKLYAALEPMTAPVNALVAKQAPRVKPGFEFWATFQVELSSTSQHHAAGVSP